MNCTKHAMAVLCLMLCCSVIAHDDQTTYSASLIDPVSCEKHEKPVTKELYFSQLLKTVEELVTECKNLKESLTMQSDFTDNAAIHELCDRLSVSINENNQIVSPDVQSLHAKALAKLLKRSKELKALVDLIHTKDLRGLKTALDKVKKELVEELSIIKNDIQANQDGITNSGQMLENIEMRVAYLESVLLSVEQKVMVLADAYQDLASTIGSTTDESANADDLDSVIAIDQAQLSLITWLKTVYKQLRADDYIS
ncbi:MAG: hypothetical protein ACOYT8_00620 [Candidatus Dependentiae bacterium]